MMEFVASPRMIDVTIDDQPYKMRSPTISDRKKFSEAFKKIEDDEKALDFFTQWFEELGLPRDASEKMDLTTFKKFVRFIVDPEKKS